MSTLDERIDHAYENCGETPELLSAIDLVLQDHNRAGARAAFERAGARDFLGLEAEAIPLYRQAFEQGLGEPERLQCLIQLSSSLRNVGQAQEADLLLREAREEASAENRDWVDAFLALALHSSGEPAQALSVALKALTTHLTKYRRAVSSYVDALE